MTTNEKLIKNIAIVLALTLAISIILIIFSSIIKITSFFEEPNKEKTTNLLTITENFPKSFELDIENSNISIIEGDIFQIETNNKNISYKENYNKITIKEKKSPINSTRNTLIITIPKKHIFEELEFETGAGKIEIENILSNFLALELGAGKTTINNMVILKEIEIDGGVGNIEIKNSQLNNLKLEMGVGDLDINTILTGKNKIEMGIGNINLNLLDQKNNYSIKTNEGIGNITINNKKISDFNNYGTGNNLVIIDGGIGNINISFQE